MQQVPSRSLTDLAPAEELPELRQRAMQEASNAFLITDAGQPDNPIVDANPAFTSLTGYPREAVLGRNCRFLQGPDTDPASVAILRQAIFTKRPEAVTILNYRADGTAFWNEVTVSPLRSAMRMRPPVTMSVSSATSAHGSLPLA